MSLPWRALVTNLLEDRRQEHRVAFDQLHNLGPELCDAAQAIIHCLHSHKMVLVCGNGGSASDAQHFAGELVGRFTTERRGLPAIALGASDATLTSISNDYGYAQAFARQVGAYQDVAGVLVAISTSGNSEAILKAAEAAKSAGMVVIGLTGSTGGKLRDLCRICLRVPSTATPRIQEAHIFLIHLICELVDHECSSS